MPDPWLPLELEGHGGLTLSCLLDAKGDERRSAVVLPEDLFLGGGIAGAPARPELGYTRALLREQALG